MTTVTTVPAAPEAVRRAAAEGLPQPRRGARWRWSYDRSTRPSGVLAVTRRIARHRRHLRRG